MRCYGYDGSGRTIIEEEAVVLRDVGRRLLAGEGVRSVVADLRARMVPTSTGGQWTQQSLTRLMRNPALAGVDTHRPAIFDKRTHRRLRDLLNDPGRQQPKTTNVRKYLLSGGLLVCGNELPDDTGAGTHRCGKVLYTQPSNSGSRGYVCRSGSPSYGCGRIRIAAEALEEEVAARALARLGSARVRHRLEKAVGAAMNAGTEDVTAALEALQQRLQEAGVAYARREISMVTMKALEKETGRERKALQERMAQAERLRSLPATSPEALAAWWVDAPLERRRELLSLVLDHIVVKPATRRGPVRLDVDRLEFVWK